MKQKTSKRPSKYTKQKHPQKDDKIKKKQNSNLDENQEFDAGVRTISNNCFKTNFHPKSSSIDIRMFMQIYCKKARSIKIQQQFRKTSAMMQGNQVKQQRKGFIGSRNRFLKRFRTQQTQANKNDDNQLKFRNMSKQQLRKTQKQQFKNPSKEQFESPQKKQQFVSHYQSINRSQKLFQQSNNFQYFKRVASQFQQNQSKQNQTQYYDCQFDYKNYQKDNFIVFKERLKEKLSAQNNIQQRDYLTPVISQSVPVHQNVLLVKTLRNSSKPKAVNIETFAPKQLNKFVNLEYHPNNSYKNIQHRRHNLKPNFMYNLDLYRKKGSSIINSRNSKSSKNKRTSMNQTGIDFANKTKSVTFYKSPLTVSRQDIKIIQKQASSFPNTLVCSQNMIKK